MDLHKTVKLFEELREKISENRDYLCGNETVTRVLLVDTVLENLGWDVRNPHIVELEYEPATSKRSAADYVLKNGDQNIAIVEAKRLGTNIGELRHREQADGYARYGGVKFFILTDGANWALYERDLMTSLEVLEPIVQFNLETDDLTRCTLNALSMWRSNLGSGEVLAAASEPVLSVDEDRNRLGHPTDDEEPPKTDDQSWVHLDDVKYNTRGPKPTRIRFPDQTEIPIRSWNKVWINIAEWVTKREPQMTACRFGNTKPTVIKTADKDFWAQGGYQLSNGLWIEPGVTGNTLLRTARAFLEHFNVEPSSVSIRFD